MKTGRLSGLVALVTGAGGGTEGGIGAGIALCLAREGAHVAVNDLDESYAQLTVDEIKRYGVEGLVAVGDVSDTAQVNAMVEKIINHFGQLDILVNNAGIGGRIPAVERLTNEIWWKTIAVDLTGPFKLARAVIPHMRRRQFGRIINISSLAGQRTGFMSGAPYTAAKSGLLGFTRHLAVEVGGAGITVNAIMPGGTMTPPLKKKYPVEVHKALDEGNPTGRLNRPEDIGEAAVFLASKQAENITGIALPVDGGISTLAGDFNRYKAISGKDAG